MPSEKAVQLAIGEFVRDELAPISNKRGGKTRLAEDFKVEVHTLSKFLRGGGLGPETLPAFVRDLADGSYDKLREKALAHVKKKHGHIPDDVPLVARQPHTSGIPGWMEAEASARKTWARLQIPDWAWERARHVSGVMLPETITPETVKNTAAFLFTNGKPGK